MTDTTTEMYEPEGTAMKREIKIPLQPHERIENGKLAGDLELEIIKLESSVLGLKEEIKTMNNVLKTKSDNRRELLETLQTGMRKAICDVVEVMCQEEQLVKYYFNGEVVDQRKMESDDYQMDLAIDNTKEESTDNVSPIFDGEQDDSTTEPVVETTETDTE